jgi:hypothetical protein
MNIDGDWKISFNLYKNVTSLISNPKYQDMLASDDGFFPRYLLPLPVAPIDEDEHEEDDCFNFLITDILILYL